MESLPPANSACVYNDASLQPAGRSIDYEGVCVIHTAAPTSCSHKRSRLCRTCRIHSLLPQEVDRTNTEVKDKQSQLEAFSTHARLPRTLKQRILS